MTADDLNAALKEFGMSGSDLARALAEADGSITVEGVIPTVSRWRRGSQAIPAALALWVAERRRHQSSV